MKNKNDNGEVKQETNTRNRTNMKLSVTVVKTVLFCLFTAVIIYVTIKFAPYITQLASEREELKEMLASYGIKGVLIFISIQIIQVIIAAIPGEPVQIAGGYIFGVALGTVYSLIGITIGYLIVFAITRVLGYELVQLVVPVKQYNRLKSLINKRKSEAVIFLLFLIPGIPKDVLVYIAGLTPIRTLRFFITVTIARIPALIGSSYIGANLRKENYLIAGIISVGAAVLFITGLIFRERITKLLHSLIKSR
jgi:uncharacterized membrane protein YdjX (TVP38/TMEM64 family)